MADPIRSLEDILAGNGLAPGVRAIGVVQALLVEIDDTPQAPDRDADGDIGGNAGGDAPARPTRAIAALVLTKTPPAPATAATDAVRARYGLSPRETAVARLVASGLSNRDVAASLGLSPYTARNHTARVLAKTGTRSRARLAALFGEMGGDR